MTFNPNIPQPTDKLSVSQGNILTNFQTSNTSFGVNHVAFDVAVNNGKHKFVEMPVGTIPVGLAASETTLYAKTVSGASELMMTRDNSGIEIQLTGPGNCQSLTNNYTPQAGGPAVGTKYSAGYSFLPGGVIYQYGFYDNGAGGISPSTGTVKFLRTFTNASSVVVIISPICKSGGTSTTDVISLQQGSITTTTFDWNATTSTSAYRGFSWIAMGV